LPDSDGMTQGAASHRRIGAILVERGLITEDQLVAALTEQSENGRPLGEICVDRYALDRLHLADALAQQWDEIRAVPELPATPVLGVRRMAPPQVEPRPQTPPAGEQELRDLLAEAQAARTELESKTDELSSRLAALESLVADVTAALAEIRPADQAPARDERDPQAGGRQACSGPGGPQARREADADGYGVLRRSHAFAIATRCASVGWFSNRR
jgi:hypothetical protein